MNNFVDYFEENEISELSSINFENPEIGFDVDFKIKERTVTVMNKKTGNNSLYSQFVVCLSC